MNTEQAIERCRAEQERCKQHLADPALSEDDKKGAALGLDDWFFEELLEIGAFDGYEEYEDFVAKKSHHGSDGGFAPKWLPDCLFDFQRYLTDWAIRSGRSAIFADCGMGKTLMQEVWAENVSRQTGKRVLILTPLAVASQTVREAHKFGIDAGISMDSRLVVTNYEKLHHFKPDDFGGVVCDESSILKNFDGARKSQITAFMRNIPYRLLCTATAAPNDYVELGTSSEALGYLGHMDMLGRFFKNDQNTIDGKGAGFGAARNAGGWRFKGHAEMGFWKWVCTWARACRKPSDLGFSDETFTLPELIERDHIIQTATVAPGMLFSMPATNMREERAERRRTIEERCEYAAGLTETSEPVVVWCHLNDEGDLLEQMIPDSRQIAGSTPDEEKVEIYDAFRSGSLRVLVIKDKIGAWGLNWQHCAHVIRFATHSYESHYQAVRRCWRFGQNRPVYVDLIVTEGERHVSENLRRKSEAADRMFSMLVEHMNDAQKVEPNTYTERIQYPSWLPIKT